ncbi:hypothetical protein Golob_002375 [Gossypium lobatum]|uniref:Uncharacterized protein n=1 Tax=Gossypium lobatum TaxID=34289 RepID=A0A7J8N4Y0_9ROSI|nr:hypothetical protein [Gossypium lobatum]
MGDSKTIINKCKTEARDKSVLGAIIDDIQNNKTRFQKLFFDSSKEQRMLKRTI